MASRSKRAAEDFLRASSPVSKKPRFDARNPSTLVADAPEEDLILDADVIGKSGAQTKRNAVNIDGYDSDSDNDNFDARAARKDGKKDVEDDEKDEDMFAEPPDGDDDEERENVATTGKGTKAVRFLEQEEIEGQNLSSRSGGHVAADLLLNPNGKSRQTEDVESSSESGADSDRDQLPDEMEEDLAAEIGAGGKKRHAPRLDAFNLKGEEEEGRYDESGNFVRKATDPDASNDGWLEGLSKKDMKAAKAAQEKRDEVQRRKDVEEDATLTSTLLGTLLEHLETGESVLEALQRLNKNKPVEKKVPKWKKKKLAGKETAVGAMEVDSAPRTEDAVETKRLKAVEALTGAADALYARAQHGIYDTTREALTRQYKRETGEEWTAPARTGEARYEYRWADARDGLVAHGPYEGSEVKGWVDAGYFGDGVEFRRVGEGDDEWSRVLDLDD